MDPAWASAVIGALGFIGGAVAVTWRGGRREGKLDACIEQLTAITGDHETRLRTLEGR